jgi:hypothetical protein
LFPIFAVITIFLVFVMIVPTLSFHRRMMEDLWLDTGGVAFGVDRFVYG